MPDLQQLNPWNCQSSLVLKISDLLEVSILLRSDIEWNSNSDQVLSPLKEVLIFCQ